MRRFQKNPVVYARGEVVLLLLAGLAFFAAPLGIVGAAAGLRSYEVSPSLPAPAPQIENPDEAIPKAVIVAGS